MNSSIDVRRVQRKYNRSKEEMGGRGKTPKIGACGRTRARRRHNRKTINAVKYPRATLSRWDKSASAGASETYEKRDGLRLRHDAKAHPVWSVRARYATEGRTSGRGTRDESYPGPSGAQKTF